MRHFAIVSFGERTLGESMQLALGKRNFKAKPVSPFREIGAYEALWDEDGLLFAVSPRSFARIPVQFLPTLLSREWLSVMHPKSLKP